MSTEQTERCPRCGGTTSSQAPGSLTQWMVVCSCAAMDAEPQEITLVRLCRKCGKRINLGRSGSLTQWVFRLDYCDCEEPDPVDATAADVVPATVEDSQPVSSFEDLEELEIEPEKFPVQRYKPVSIIGKGGSGVVYYCVDKLLDKAVAVKCLHSMNATQLVAFQNEARATSRLNHPAIIKVFDFGATEGGVPFMAMEFFDGVSLSRMIAEKDHLAPEDVAEIFHQICGGLAHAHAAGIMHRDVKSSNLLIRARKNDVPEVRIIDFGVAVCKEVERDELAKGHTMVGSPGYMAPDQAVGEVYDERSEIYGLGCSMFEALTGSIPFEGESPLDLMRRRAEEEAPALAAKRPELEFSDDLEAVLAHCLARTKEGRYQSLQELADDLDCLRPVRELVAVPEEPSRPVVYKAGSYLLATMLVVSGVVLALNMGLGVVKKSEKLTSTPLAIVKMDADRDAVGFDVYDEYEKARFELRNRHGERYLIARGKVQNEDLKILPKLKFHSNLSLDRSAVNEKGLQYLVGLDIESLDITGLDVGDKGLDVLSQIKTLTFVDLGGTKVTDQGLSCLKDWHRLKGLGVGGEQITDTTLEIISQIDTLEALEIDHPSHVTVKGVAALSRLKYLKQLDLSYTPLDDAAIAAIGKLKRVTTLHVDEVGLNDENIKSLVGLDLRELKARNNKLSTAALAQIAKFKNLKKLMLTGCYPMRDAALEQLQKQLPDCDIVR